MEKQKKEDRSFSEFIRSHMKQGDLKELEGIGFSEGLETRNELLPAQKYVLDSLHK